MTQRYQVEALLRPAVENWSALSAFSMAGILTGLHAWLFLPRPVALSGGIFFSAYGLWRLRQGRKILRYRRRLWQQPRFTVPRDRVPVSDHQLYVGRGFRWQARHTQRLRDCLNPDNARFFREPRRQALSRRLAVALDRPGRRRIGRLLLSDHPCNPLRPLPPVGGRPEIHGVGMWEGERNLFAPIGDRVGHTLVLGTTRVGKTRLAEILITQDIRRGDTVIVFDPKGDAELLLSMYTACHDSGRLEKFHIFHLAYPEHSDRYNPIGSYSRITEVANRIANALPGEGNSSAFREFGWRFTNIIAQALQVLEERPSYRTILTHVSNIDNLLIRYGCYWLARNGPANWDELIARTEYGLTGPRDDPDRPSVPNLTNAERSRDIEAVCVARVLKETMQSRNNHDPVAEGLLSAFTYDRAYFDKIVSSLGPFLEKLTTGDVAALFNPDHGDLGAGHVFDWESVIRNNRIVYVGLAALQDVTVASAVGNAMFSDLTSVAGKFYARDPDADIPHGLPPEKLKPISLHADEFNELIGDEFIPMLNKAGGAGFQVTAYTQTLSDVEARIGSKAKARQVEGNFNTLVMLRVRSAETAELLTDMLPPVQVSQLMTVSTATHSTDPGSDKHFGSQVQDRVSTSDVPMLQPGDLTRLPKGHAFLLMQGGQLYKLRIPLPAAGRKPVPEGILQLINLMRRPAAVTAIGQDRWWTANMPPDRQVAEDIRGMLETGVPNSADVPDSGVAA